MIAHPRPNREFDGWFRSQLERGTEIIIPEICDYEVRRSLLLAGLMRSVERLDELKEVLTYLPLCTKAILQAAQFWADARKQGRPTADFKELDSDVILAAQAKQTGGMVVTDNTGHLALFVEAKSWREIP